MTRTGTLSVTRLSFKRLRTWLGGSYAPYLFILPFLLIFIAFEQFPLTYALRLSFTRWHGIGVPKFIGLSNYTFLLTDSGFWESIYNSVYLWVIIVPLQTLFAVLVAYLLSLPHLRLRGFFRITYLLSYLVPLVAIAQVWKVLFDTQFGAVNFALAGLGLPAIGWLTDPAWSKLTLALMFFWKSSGFAILIMLAAIQGIQRELYEAAALDGATSFQQFTQITLPLMRRAIAFYSVIATLAVLQMFAEPYVLTQGGPYTSTTTAGYLLNMYMKQLDLGTGAANSFLLTLLVMAISLLMLRFLQARGED
jgi:ABC-type sugar transport system permease subunit